ncbi:hypothetical protein D3OALGA1CA_1452 [Olavius algarvensis associated proteobacterium Delta 3]|nr:hypothetical protein D3OALGB2SA_900 [Olavius algarvensis associated proteobacterium Delta 3]CAB5101352.1 hypothetical protein D3OALGA1CA_1452 [Olavius algarvensis associated proteobacterium Delta 3]
MPVSKMNRCNSNGMTIGFQQIFEYQMTLCQLKGSILG